MLIYFTLFIACHSEIQGGLHSLSQYKQEDGTSNKKCNRIRIGQSETKHISERE